MKYLIKYSFFDDFTLILFYIEQWKESNNNINFYILQYCKIKYFYKIQSNLKKIYIYIFTKIDSFYYSAYKNIKSSKSEYFPRYFIFYIKNIMTKFKIFQEILNKKKASL